MSKNTVEYIRFRNLRHTFATLTNFFPLRSMIVLVRANPKPTPAILLVRGKSDV